MASVRLIIIKMGDLREEERTVSQETVAESSMTAKEKKSWVLLQAKCVQTSWIKHEDICLVTVGPVVQLGYLDAIALFVSTCWDLCPFTALKNKTTKNKTKQKKIPKNKRLVYHYRIQCEIN